MENNIAISVENISKKFKVYFDKSISLKEKVLFKSRRKFEERTVLENISFQVKKGEAIGIIGQNGCGKSTMLKLLTKIMYPDAGQIVTDGRISALIELGAGFHPDLSGRENIYTNAAIFGLNHSEINRRIEDIIAFSELGDYIDNPVRTYSSGMYMRLAFSVAINVDADILLVDEILAVGDASFQAKCFNRLREIKASGTTIVIVSHSLGQIEQICDRSIWIHKGKIRADGLPREVHPAYLNYMAQQLVEHSSEPVQQPPPEESAKEQPQAEEEIPEEKEHEKTRWGNGAVRFTRIRLLDRKGEEKGAFLTGEPMTIEMQYQVNGPLNNPVFGIAIFRDDGVHCYGVNTRIDHIKGIHLNNQGKFYLMLPESLLLPGNFILDVAVESEDGFPYDYYRYAAKFQMVCQENEEGLVHLPHTWAADGTELQ